ncbi:hypothetical protein IQ235_10185 [Oscillatoriales cyanobacterium LEGE 11467]|uniref:Uncharacterized protein n=1 Tax=Zarconia navalis LEGE 11467 TaxID=1828826 RepID=A0A928W0P8_9CYAN|nr:hypothetical protein [Zarconia navalis]MBE9041145.1 hypothetical protein [Zarconia navalis LEGE 11467]
MNKKLRNILVGAGVAAVGAIGTKKAVDYFKNRGKEEPIDGGEEADAEATAPDEVAYAVAQDNSGQSFVDASFGSPGRYRPTRPPKVFDYQGNQYMVIWAYDNDKQKNQMLAFLYTDAGRKMVASVGYTADATDYNVSLGDLPFAVEIASNGEKIESGQGETAGTDEVDFVLA